MSEPQFKPTDKAAYEATIDLSIKVLVKGTHGEFGATDSDDLHERLVAYVRTLLTQQVADALWNGPSVQRGAGGTRYHFPGEAYVTDGIPIKVTLDTL